MLKNKGKNLISKVILCAAICAQVVVPQTVFGATKKAVEKAGEAFVAALEEEADTEVIAGTENEVKNEKKDAEENKNTAGTENKNGEASDMENTSDPSESDRDETVMSEEELRQQIVDFALQFEGNPYVYGGTSLTNGADCSGFVMSVFAQFGYSLPRVAADQYYQSVKKNVADLEPGDLVFYGSGISHVALYIGNGQIIHASTSASGIKISKYDYETPAGVGTYIEADGFYSE